MYEQTTSRVGADDIAASLQAAMKAAECWKQMNEVKRSEPVLGELEMHLVMYSAILT